MQQEIATPVDLKVLMNHIYEYKKGVRRLVLYTFNKKYESFAITRLERQNIDYIIQPVGNDRLNPVSYTHLDVYKRQMSKCSKAVVNMVPMS